MEECINEGEVDDDCYTQAHAREAIDGSREHFRKVPIQVGTLHLPIEFKRTGNWSGSMRRKTCVVGPLAVRYINEDCKPSSGIGISYLWANFVMLKSVNF